MSSWMASCWNSWNDLVAVMELRKARSASSRKTHIMTLNLFMECSHLISDDH